MHKETKEDKNSWESTRNLHKTTKILKRKRVKVKDLCGARGKEWGFETCMCNTLDFKTGRLK
jgi:hypothetical protein